MAIVAVDTNRSREINFPTKFKKSFSLLFVALVLSCLGSQGSISNAAIANSVGAGLSASRDTLTVLEDPNVRNKLNGHFLKSLAYSEQKITLTTKGQCSLGVAIIEKIPASTNKDPNGYHTEIVTPRSIEVGTIEAVDCENNPGTHLSWAFERWMDSWILAALASADAFIPMEYLEFNAKTNKFRADNSDGTSAFEFSIDDISEGLDQGLLEVFRNNLNELISL